MHVVAADPVNRISTNTNGAVFPTVAEPERAPKLVDKLILNLGGDMGDYNFANAIRQAAKAYPKETLDLILLTSCNLAKKLNKSRSYSCSVMADILKQNKCYRQAADLYEAAYKSENYNRIRAGKLGNVVNLVIALSNLKDKESIDKCLGYCNLLLQKEPTNFITLKIKTDCLLKTQNYVEAKQTLDFIFQIDPNNKAILISKVLYLLAQKNYQQAEEGLEICISRLLTNPNDRRYLFLSARCLLQIGQCDLALNQLDLIDRNCKNVTPVDVALRIRIQLYKNNNTEALTSILFAEQHWPDFSDFSKLKIIAARKMLEDRGQL